MKLILNRIIIALCILGLSGLPGQTKSSRTRPTASQKKKRPPATKKTAKSKRKPRPRGKKPTTRKKPTRKKQVKKRPSAKKRPAKKTTRKKRPTKSGRRPAPKKSPTQIKTSTTPKAPALNPMELATEFKTMTEELETSRRKLAMATAYLEPAKRRKIVTIESRSITSQPVPAPANMENAVRTAEAERNWTKVRDLTLTQIKKNPLNP
ncbi:MAG: hypothetical protein GXO90_09715, partial [FCB group bacterium]|nr:hypothetical protein [FCB group bacterium]